MCCPKNCFLGYESYTHFIQKWVRIQIHDSIPLYLNASDSSVGKPQFLILGMLPYNQHMLLPEKTNSSLRDLSIFFAPYHLFLLNSHFFLHSQPLICCCSVAQSCPTLCNPMDSAHQVSLPSPSLRVCSNSCPLSLQCHSTILSSVISLLLPSIILIIRVFSNESVLRIRWPKYWGFNFSISLSNEYSGLFPLGRTGLISLQSKGLSRVFPRTTVQKHQFFSTQFSLQSNFYIHT